MASSVPIVTVRGEARLEVPPDLAGLSVTVNATGSSPDQVRSQLATASNALRDVLAEHRAAIERSSTTALRVSPTYGRNGKITGHRGSVGASLDVTDFEALSDLVTALLVLPDAQLDGPWWSLSPGHPVHREARLAAVADARRRAEDYAAAVGAHVGDLVEISDLDGGFGGGPLRAPKGFAMAAESAPAFDFEPAVQAVTGQVSVRYTLS